MSQSLQGEINTLEVQKEEVYCLLVCPLLSVKATYRTYTLKQSLPFVIFVFMQDSKTVVHMTANNLLRYKFVSVHDAVKLIEEAGESVPPETSKSSSLDRGNIPTSSRASHALHASQKGKKDTLTFTTGVRERNT